MTTYHGRCLCNAVQFSADAVEAHHHACHCGICRRWSGGPMFAALSEGVSFSGEENIGRYASSEWAQRGFCKQCGTALFYFLLPANQYFISVGAFDDTSSFKLVREIFADRQPPGYAFAGDIERWSEAETLAKFSGS